MRHRIWSARDVEASDAAVAEGGEPLRGISDGKGTPEAAPAGSSRRRLPMVAGGEGVRLARVVHGEVDFALVQLSLRHSGQHWSPARAADRRWRKVRSVAPSHGASPCQGCDHRQMRTAVGGQSVLRPGVAESEGWSSPSMAPMPNARPSGAFGAPQPRSGAPKAPGLTAPLGRSDDACRRRPHLSPPRAPPRQCGFQVRARLRPGNSEPGQPHIRSAHTAAAPQSRVRRVGLRRARPFLFPALEATQQIGSPTWIRQDLIRVLPNGNATAGALRRPSSPHP